MFKNYGCSNNHLYRGILNIVWLLEQRCTSLFVTQNEKKGIPLTPLYASFVEALQCLTSKDIEMVQLSVVLLQACNDEKHPQAPALLDLLPKTAAVEKKEYPVSTREQTMSTEKQPEEKKDRKRKGKSHSEKVSHL